MGTGTAAGSNHGMGTGGREWGWTPVSRWWAEKAGSQDEDPRGVEARHGERHSQGGGIPRGLGKEMGAWTTGFCTHLGGK